MAVDGVDLHQWARRRAAGALLLTLALSAGLVWTTELPALDSLFLPGLLVLLPVLSGLQVPFVREEELERMSAYVGSSATILALGAASLVLGVRLTDWAALGLARPEPGELVLWTLGLTGFGILLMEGFHRAGVRESWILRRLLPRSRRERRAFVGVSFSAGIGEELTYRGYTLVALQVIGSGPWTAAVVSSVAFGFLHAYQGAAGILRTGLLGFAMAASVLMTGSLWPAVAAHVLVDLLGGLVLGRRYAGSPATES